MAQARRLNPLEDGYIASPSPKPRLTDQAARCAAYADHYRRADQQRRQATADE